MRAGLLAWACGAAMLAGCEPEEDPDEARLARRVPSRIERGAEARSEEINPRLLRRFAAVDDARQPRVEVTEEQVQLGRALWFETQLSQDQDLSCNSCHDLARYGTDGRATSSGHRGQRGRRNAPTVFHIGGHLALFWDGRAPTIEAQAVGPIQNPAEMAMTAPEVEQRLRASRTYPARFRAAFPGEAEPVTLANVGRALGAFERRLVTRSRWDDYLAGQRTALNAQETRGLRTFLGVGCMGCHTGPEVGASSFQVAGAVEPWPTQTDLGRFEVTHDPADRMVFRVLTLRNVAHTGPYFHDGSATTLPQAIRMMGRHQLGITLSDEEVSDLEAFLGALGGELPAALIAPPT